MAGDTGVGATGDLSSRKMLQIQIFDSGAPKLTDAVNEQWFLFIECNYNEALPTFVWTLIKD